MYSPQIRCCTYVVLNEPISVLQANNQSHECLLCLYTVPSLSCSDEFSKFRISYIKYIYIYWSISSRYVAHMIRIHALTSVSSNPFSVLKFHFRFSGANAEKSQRHVVWKHVKLRSTVRLILSYNCERSHCLF